MMRNPIETIGNLIDKQGISFINSKDKTFPSQKNFSHNF